MAPMLAMRQPETMAHSCQKKSRAPFAHPAVCWPLSLGRTTTSTTAIPATIATNNHASDDTENEMSVVTYACPTAIRSRELAAVWMGTNNPIAKVIIR